MHRHHSILTRNIILIAVSACSFCSAHVAQAAPSLQVTLSSPKGVYTLGEPVRLAITVKNVSDQTLYAWVDKLKWQQIQIEISNDGERFHTFVPGTREDYKIIPETRPLEPGKEKQYSFRILYTYYFSSKYARLNRLAFEKHGGYLIKARYRTHRPLETNTIKIKVKQPQGSDAKLWQKLNQPAILKFLQSGEVLKGHEKLPLRAVEILKSAPKSSYANDLRWALKTYYYRDRRQAKRLWKLKEDEARLIRGVTGITVPPPQPFPNDMRLAQLITYQFPKRTPLEQALQVISRQSGVTLRLHPKLRVRTMSSIRVTEPLRKLMRNLSVYKAEWVRQGEGYLLKPADGKDQKKSQTDKSSTKK